ncbi:MAG: amino acid permease [Rhodospirillaceae bacterium]|jgi:basic amino acid/polyamine antiporter, APA family|nr:amino acid permease [Rhodospirillaceae bacterium]MBT5455915.1 amino acid permease [Rhodospirillaceae bacterium]
MPPQQTLKRSISLPLLTLYGLGTTIGAGIFVLIGKIAGVSGVYAPLAFLLASLLAGLSAFSFAELSSRYPESAGEAAYVREGLGSQTLALIVGLFVVTAGLVSTSAIIIGFSGYLAEFVSWPPVISRIAIVVILGFLVCWGVAISVALAAIITLAEIGVLLIIIVSGAELIVMGDGPVETAASLGGDEIWLGVITGALLAFYAFIGFEDMVNVAEETQNPTRVVPYAIVLTLICTTVLYVIIAAVAVNAVPITDLAKSDAPLSLIFEKASGFSGKPISAIAVVSVLNGALIQIIMASRVLYGLSRRNLLPAWIGAIHPRTKTPIAATLFCTAIVIILTSTFRIEGLAEATSIVALTIFAIVNLALMRIKWMRIETPDQYFSVPGWVPVLGFLASVALVGFDMWRRII